MGSKLAERYEWLPKDIYHRKSLDKLKEGDLQQAAVYNRIALRKNPDFEKALVLRDIISMKRDVSLNSIDQQIQHHEQILLNLMQRQGKVENLLKNQHRLSRFCIFITVSFVVLLFSALITLFIKFRSPALFSWFWPITLSLLAGTSGYFFFSLPSLRLSQDLKTREHASTLNALEKEIQHHSQKLRRLKLKLDDLQNLL
ncbi:MAG: hypothetical protein U5R06_24165 [candidate division KSB1 bacterium]|nr:hypothetical protein [candidate division KSB1 bacterium]